MRRISVTLFILGILTSPSWGSLITVSGNVSGVWDVDTVLVMGDINLLASESLVIQPGVLVLFRDHLRLTIQNNAILRAIGTEHEPIIFTAHNLVAGWQGLRFYSASNSCILRYCRFSHGKADGSPYNDDWDGGAIFCDNSAPRIDHCLFENNLANGNPNIGGGGALYCRNNSGPIISHSRFLNNETTDYGGAIYIQDCNSIVSHCIISDNHSNRSGGGIYIHGNMNSIVEYCRIENNSSGINGPSWGINGTGGGIACYNSDAFIKYNSIKDNISTPVSFSPYSTGGGIYSHDGAPTIIQNYISNNDATFSAGIYISNGALIQNNIISGNQAEDEDGGGIGAAGEVSIISNIIYDNYAYTYGGGINCQYDGSVITENVVASNHGRMGGGGIYAYSASSTTIVDNIIYDNDNEFGSSGRGGGLYIYGALHNAGKNLICGNNTGGSGGGVYWAVQQGCLSNLTVSNNFATTHGGGIAAIHNPGNHFELDLNGTISYSNLLNNIYIDPMSYILEVNYSDLGDQLWPGIGNISIDPRFVDPAHHDYRLLWGSPCIDSGNPDSLDPDGTRADMGAFFYDQSKPVRILLTPYVIPFLLSDSGGTIAYALRLDTHLETPQEATFWFDVTLPDSSTFGPLQGLTTVTVFPGEMLSWERFQRVPASAPLGVFRYNAYAVVGTDTSKDSFLFGKMGFGSEPIGPWPNWGDPLGVPYSQWNSPALLGRFKLYTNFPNPFNASTTFHFDLPQAGKVRLAVYDVSGREVAVLVDGWREAGVHKLTFNAAGLASGVYVYRLTAGEFNASGKMVLLK
ncbi:MAG: right-handed parallel beta-helix repeat-containing protein [bacterium]|nr:right-handed parallel beta-helix repeat-containing protein [bacterium]